MCRQATQEEYRNTAEVCEDGARKAKAKLDSKLGRILMAMRCFCVIVRKRMLKLNTVQLLNGAGDSLTADIGEAEASMSAVPQATVRPPRPFCGKAGFKEKRNYERIEVWTDFLICPRTWMHCIEGC